MTTNKEGKNERYKKFPFIGREEILDAQDFRPYRTRLTTEDRRVWLSNGKEWFEVEK